MLNLPPSVKNSDSSKVNEKPGAVTPKTIKRKLKFYLGCSDVEVEKFFRENKSFYKMSLLKLAKMIEFLFERKIATTTILENPFLLEMKPGSANFFNHKFRLSNFYLKHFRCHR